MFTGIITNIGHVVAASKRGEAMFKITTDYNIDSIHMGASIACSGACLTVIDVGRDHGKDWFMAQVSEETLTITTLKNWKIGTKINLERALRMGDELGGHFVTGHVDDIAKIINFEKSKDSVIFEIATPEDLVPYIAQKGSVTLDGVSLTVNAVSDSSFEVNIIPHTQKYTTLGYNQIGDWLNLEIDPIARYIARYNGAGNIKTRGQKKYQIIARLMLKKLSSIEEVIKDAAAGRMFILVDDEDRENEGDLVIPAQFADAEKVNFMARHGRGLICLALTPDRIKHLNLPLMSQANASRHQTAFTVSIEAREGISTGISAADRALTIKTAIDPEKNSHDIISPGHIFPLVAKDGGVLVRAGHTEAAVDISRMAGLNPSGVICEIMNEDGTMSRLPQLRQFAGIYKLNIATIADLISYRRKNEKLVKKIADSTLNSQFGGEFRMLVYCNNIEYAEHIVLVKGKINPGKPVLVRMHSHNMLFDSLGELNSSKSGVLQKSMQIIDKEGNGVIIIIRSPDRAAISSQLDANGQKVPQLREYGIGAQILLDLGVRDMVLLTNSAKSVIGLEGYGLHIKGTREIK